MARNRVKVQDISGGEQARLRTAAGERVQILARCAGLESDVPLTIEKTRDATAHEVLAVADIYRWVEAGGGPRFILPARFRRVSFDSFLIASDYPEHADVRDLIADFARERPERGGWFRRRSAPSNGGGIFLVGPPGVGKTHLLASAFRVAEEPKLYASFDELVAAAGPLGTQGLVDLLTAREIVCIDEVVLEDPGNIMMLVTLLHHMLENGVRVIATANMPPDEAGGKSGWMRSFHRELGSISSAFNVHRIEGRDHRERHFRNLQTPELNPGGVTLRVGWNELATLLERTHPMHDAVWLERVNEIEIAGRIEVPEDKDRALRFIRFIDRVYDRAVVLSPESSPEPAELVEPLVGDARFVWHVARGRSRLRALLG